MIVISCYYLFGFHFCSISGELVQFPVLWSILDQVIYKHDGSDSLADFAVFQISNSSLHIQSEQVSLRITIKTVDRTPPKMVSEGEWKIING